MHHGKSQGEILNSHTSKELTEKFVFMCLEPYGEKRADWRTALVCSVIANSQRDPKKQKPFKPSDFLLDFKTQYDSPSESNPELTEAQLNAYAEMLAKAFGGKVKRRGGQ